MSDLKTTLLLIDAVGKGGGGSGIQGHMTKQKALDKSDLARGASIRAWKQNTGSAHRAAATLHRRAARAQAAAGNYSAANAHDYHAKEHEEAAGKGDD